MLPLPRIQTPQSAALLVGLQDRFVARMAGPKGRMRGFFALAKPRNPLRCLSGDGGGKSSRNFGAQPATEKCSTLGGSAKKGPTMARHWGNKGPPRKCSVWSSRVAHSICSK